MLWVWVYACVGVLPSLNYSCCNDDDDDRNVSLLLLRWMLNYRWMCCRCFQVIIEEKIYQELKHLQIWRSIT